MTVFASPEYQKGFEEIMAASLHFFILTLAKLNKGRECCCFLYQCSKLLAVQKVRSLKYVFVFSSFHL